jgi:hypothetical protein
MKIKYTINLNEGLPDQEPEMIEISKSEAAPKSRTAHRNLMKKYGATKQQRDAYSILVYLQPE